MSLYLLSTLVLILGIVLTIIVFYTYRKRLLDGQVQATLDLDNLKSIFQSTAVEKALGYALVAIIGYLILQTIKQGFDFALLMIGATAFTGLVWPKR